MATTMTDTGELTYLSFGIEKVESTPDGDLMVYGKASDGSIDSDQQIVDPQWMTRAVKEWLDTGANLRVQHNPQRDPAGIGVSAETDADGATWVKGLIIEPIAQKLVSKGALRAYSVGIAHPTINRDITAKGGRITDGELVEISLVDRPANKRCGIQLVKSVDGVPEYTGELFGEQTEIDKALGIAEVTKGVRTADEVRENMDLPAWQDDMSLTFTPNDLAKILQNKIIDQHYDDLAKQALYVAEAGTYKRDIDTATRRNLASQGQALPDGSYPIENAGDLHNAAVLARSGHGNVAGARALIARRAKELGVSNPLSDTDKDKLDGVEDVTPKEAAPDVIKDPEGDKGTKPKKGGKGKKLPPWMKPSSGDGDADDNGGPSDNDADDKSVEADVEKFPDPKSASGASEAADMDSAPCNDAPESPMPAGRKTPDTKAMHSSPEVAALLRFKSLGVDPDLGRLHDMTCPAYHPDEVAKYHPYADFKSVIDEGVWQRKALEAAAGRSIKEAMEMQGVWQAAVTLKSADEGMLNDLRLEAHKAFRDANPGPTSYPSPGSMSPGGYKRPLITDGHSATSSGHSGPNTSAMVASGPAHVGDYSKPPLSSGHQSPSPSFMKTNWEYPSETGVPTKLTYAHTERELALNAIGRMHTHLGSVVPRMCSLDMNPQSPMPPNPATTAAGLGKTNETTEVEKSIVEPDLLLADMSEFESDDIYKAFKKLRKKLGKKVIAGKMTVDEARAKLGRTATQKGDEDPAEEVTKGETGWYDKGGTLPSAPGVVKNATAEAEQVEEQVKWGLDYIKKTYGPDVMKSAIAEAMAPLMDRLTEQQKVNDDLKKTIDAIADSPDPRGEPFSGLAFNPIRKSAKPAAIADQAAVAERTQQMMLRSLDHTWRTSDNPAEREAAFKAINKMRGMSE